jgi:hypothetical protein
VVNVDTGEWLPGSYRLVIDGSVIIPPDEAEKRRKRARQKYDYRCKQYRAEDRGHFVFVKGGGQFDDLPPESLSRLIYLSTYLPWGSNALYKTQRKGMTKKDLPAILDVSQATVKRFWCDVSPRYLTEDCNGNLVIQNDYVMCGSIGRGKGQSYRKIYIDTFRSLYRNSRPSQHKLIGQILQHLDDLHIERNMFCREPRAKDYGTADPLTPQDFCLIVGYSQANVARLQRDYEALRFERDGHFSKAISFCEDGIIVNPFLTYNGDDHAPLLRYFQ